MPGGHGAANKSVRQLRCHESYCTMKRFPRTQRLDCSAKAVAVELAIVRLPVRRARTSNLPYRNQRTAYLGQSGCRVCSLRHVVNIPHLQVRSAAELPQPGVSLCSI